MASRNAYVASIDSKAKGYFDNRSPNSYHILLYCYGCYTQQSPFVSTHRTRIRKFCIFSILLINCHSFFALRIHRLSGCRMSQPFGANSGPSILSPPIAHETPSHYAQPAQLFSLQGVGEYYYQHIIIISQNLHKRPAKATNQTPALGMFRLKR
jgi:hypothetical protein